MASGLHLNVLLFQEGDVWIAQVLEHDMAAHGPTPVAALAAVELIIQAHVNFDTRHQRQPFSRLKRAPDVYWRALATARPWPQPQRHAMHPADITAKISDETFGEATL